MVNKYQQGGTMTPEQEEIILAAIGYISTLPQEEQPKSQEQIQQMVQQLVQPLTQLKQQKPDEFAQLVQLGQQQAQQQATKAQFGAKLEYLRRLKYGKGGKACPSCNKKEVERKGYVKKRYFGGKSKKYQEGGEFEDYYKFKRYEYDVDTLNLGPGYQIINQRHYPVYERLFEEPAYGIERGSETYFDFDLDGQDGRNIYVYPNGRDTVYYDKPTHYIEWIPIGKAKNQKKSKENFNKKHQDYKSKKK